MGHSGRRIWLLVFLIMGALLFHFTGLSEQFSLDRIQRMAIDLKTEAQTRRVRGVLVFIGVFALVNLWLPSAAVLTLLGGFLYGPVVGTLYVLIAQTAGALLGFEISRHLIGRWIQHRWREQLMGFNREFSRRGVVYLVLARMIPMMPYGMINCLAGVTHVRARTLAWTTALGSLPGVMVFTYAGQRLLVLTSMEKAVHYKALAPIVLLGIFIILACIVRALAKKMP